MTILRSRFHLLKFDPSARRDSTAVLYLIGSQRNLVLADVLLDEEDDAMEIFSFCSMEGKARGECGDSEICLVMNWE